MRILLVIVPLMILTACGASASAIEEDGSSSNLITHATERQGVRLSLATPVEVVLEGEPVVIQAALTNLSDEPIAYLTGSFNDPAFRVFLDTNLAGRIKLLGPENRAINGMPPVETAYLEPGQIIQHELVWDRMMAGKFPAPSGTYHIQADFEIWDEEQELRIPVEVETSVDIQAVESIITPQEALVAALADERLEEWYQGHGEQLFCRLPNKQGIFIFRHEIYLEAPEQVVGREPSQARCSIKLVAFPAWEIQLSGSHNVKPKLDKVFVDAIEGTVIVVRPELN